MFIFSWADYNQELCEELIKLGYNARLVDNPFGFDYQGMHYAIQIVGQPGTIAWDLSNHFDVMIRRIKLETRSAEIQMVMLDVKGKRFTRR